MKSTLMVLALAIATAANYAADILLPEYPAAIMVGQRGGE